MDVTNQNPPSDFSEGKNFYKQNMNLFVNLSAGMGWLVGTGFGGGVYKNIYQKDAILRLVLDPYSLKPIALYALTVMHNIYLRYS